MTPHYVESTPVHTLTRELTIWEACGDYWTLPRSKFEGSPVPYKPMFSDGWSPGYLVFEVTTQHMIITQDT